MHAKLKTYYDKGYFVGMLVGSVVTLVFFIIVSYVDTWLRTPLTVGHVLQMMVTLVFFIGGCCLAYIMHLRATHALEKEV